MELIKYIRITACVLNSSERCRILKAKNVLLQQYIGLSANPLRDKKPKAPGHQEQTFTDCHRIRAVGGKGGNGASTFLHLWCNPGAGPSGGDGGNGGHIIFQASRIVKSLNPLKSVYMGTNGEKGQPKDCSGKSADHTIIKVPLGTIIKNEKGHSIASLCEDGDMFLAARGGAGGKGNHFFMTNENKAPVISEYGADGEDRTYTLEMQTIAHVGLIGFPNAGKSTLLRAISRARPKVAAYPFTTLRPHVGIVHYDDYEQIAVADIPGLIPDAHLNRGLGISFLKHIERCLCLLYVIDLAQPEPWLQIEILQSELEHYKTGLSTRTHAIVGNKIDLSEAQQNLQEIQEKMGLPVIGISAKTGLNLFNLLKHLRHIYDEKRLKDKYSVS